jgi:hypothetical protein
LKLTETLGKRSFQLVLTSFSFEPEIDLKALVQCLLPLCKISIQSNFAENCFSGGFINNQSGNTQPEASAAVGLLFDGLGDRPADCVAALVFAIV